MSILFTMWVGHINLTNNYDSGQLMCWNSSQWAQDSLSLLNHWIEGKEDLML